MEVLQDMDLLNRGLHLWSCLWELDVAMTPENGEWFNVMKTLKKNKGAEKSIILVREKHQRLSERCSRQKQGFIQQK